MGFHESCVCCFCLVLALAQDAQSLLLALIQSRRSHALTSIHGTAGMGGIRYRQSMQAGLRLYLGILAIGIALLGMMPIFLYQLSHADG